MKDEAKKIMEMNLKAVSDLLGVEACLTDQSSVNSKDLLQRNWGFDFYLRPKLLEYYKWLVTSNEHSNFTYAVDNTHHLAGWVAIVTDVNIREAEFFIDELLNDRWLFNHLKSHVKLNWPGDSARLDEIGPSVYGRRVGWYAVARILKPSLIIETGVDRGLGSTVLCRALQRNSLDGVVGRYLGTDIDPGAGLLFCPPLREFGELAIGDSLDTLRNLKDPIDLFINDSDHSADYEAAEYACISHLLSPRAIILGDNSHATDKLFQFAKVSGRRFIHFQERPFSHWYPGAGIGAAF